MSANALRRRFLIGASLWLAACSTPAVQAPGHQIIVQWVSDSESGPASAVGGLDAFNALDRKLIARAEGLYTVDGVEARGVHSAFFLYTTAANLEPAVARLIELHNNGVLPPGMQIGVLIHSEGGGAIREFQPRFPADLERFDPPPMSY